MTVGFFAFDTAPHKVFGSDIVQGNLLAKSRVVIEPYFSPAPGLAEQDPENFWKAVCDACQALWQMPGVNKESVAGVALTTQGSTVINLDGQGKPLRPAIVWLDQRRTPGLKPVSGLRDQTA